MAAITRTPRAKWIEAGLNALATGGPRAVRVEALAKDLGVSKGGFYGFFADRDALLQEMLDTWERQAIDDALAAVADEGDPRTRIHRLGMLTFADERLPVEFAIRAWAQHDATVAARLRRVDNRRMEVLREAIGAFCDDPDEVEARSLLAFCAAIAEHFLAADHPGRTRAEVLTRAAELLLRSPDVASGERDA